MLRFFRERYLVGPTRNELITGLICLIAWQLVLPFLLLPIFKAFSQNPEKAEFVYQIAYFTVSFIAVVLLFRKLLWRSWEPLKGRAVRLLGAVLTGFAVYYIVSFLIAYIIMYIPVQADNRNNAAIEDLLEQNTLIMGLCTVVLAPITEEILVRGMVFAPLCKKSPLLAYAVSILLFGGLHVVGYIGQQPATELLISFLQYVPAGLALGYAYQRTMSLWGSIALHALLNGIAVAYLF